MSIKRRLELLPEVLPKPQRASGPSSVRSRALARLSVLAALGAAQAGCGGDAAYGVVDPLPRPGGEGGSRGDNLPPSLGGGPGVAGAYGVVDPLPTPASCFANTVLTASASYVGTPAGDAGADRPNGVASRDAGVEDGGGPRTTENSDSGPHPTTRPSEVRVDLGTAPQVTLGQMQPLTPGIQLVQQISSSGHTTLVFSIPEADQAEVEFAAVCGHEQVNLRMQLVLSPDSVSVSVSNY